MIMSKPEVSSKFDVDDIRKIREYNSLRHIHMTPKEITAKSYEGLKNSLTSFVKTMICNEIFEMRRKGRKIFN